MGNLSKVAGWAVAMGMVAATGCSKAPPPAQTQHIGTWSVQVRTEPGVPKVGERVTFNLLVEEAHKPVAHCLARFHQSMPEMQMEADHLWIIMAPKTKDSAVLSASSRDFSMGGDWLLEFDISCGNEHHMAPYRYHLEWPK